MQWAPFSMQALHHRLSIESVLLREDTSAPWHFHSLPFSQNNTTPFIIFFVIELCWPMSELGQVWMHRCVNWPLPVLFYNSLCGLTGPTQWAQRFLVCTWWPTTPARLHLLPITSTHFSSVFTCRQTNDGISQTNGSFFSNSSKCSKL